MPKKVVVLSSKRGKSKLIPVLDSVGHRSVESIGIHSDAVKKLSQRIINDITTHKEVLQKFRHQLTRSTKPIVTRSPPLSPTAQRQLFATKFTRHEDDLKSLCDAIDSELIKSDQYLYNCIESAKLKVLELVGNDATLKEKLDSFAQEAETNFVNAVKEAIVRYVLQSESERKRLEVDQAPNTIEPFITVRAPVPWSKQLKQNKQQFKDSILTLEPFLRDLRHLWYQKYYDLSFLDKITFPADVLFFKSQVTINCELIRASLRYGFLADTTNLFLKRRKDVRNLSLIPGTRDYHLMETIATFTSILIRQLVIDNIEKWLFIANNMDGRQEKELFIARADYSPTSQCQLDPSPAEWPRLVVHPINEMLRVTERVPRIETQIVFDPDFDISGLKFIEKVKEDDYQILAMKRKLLSLISEEDSSRLLQEAENKIGMVQKFNRKKNMYYDTAQLIQIVREQEAFEEAAVRDIEFNWTSGIMLVNYSQLRRKIISEARDSRQVLIKNKVREFISLAQSITNQLGKIKNRLEKVTDSTEDLVFNIKLMNELRMKTRLLLKDTQHVQDNWTFMSDEGAEFLSDTDLELLNTLYYWPAKIRLAFEASDERLGSSKKKTEAKLLERIATFERSLKEIIVDLVHFKKKRLSSPLEKIPENVKALEVIEQRIDEAVAEKFAINYEEGLLGWHELSPFPEIEQIRLCKNPLDQLWRTALQFERKHHNWMIARIPDLDIPKMRFDLERLLLLVAVVEEGHNQFVEKYGESEGDEDMKQNIMTLRGRIMDFLTLQLPLLCVITIPVLREKHWKAMGQVLRQEINVTNFSTLTDVATDSLDKESVGKLEQIGKAAKREHALELFLERMKNEWISDEWPEDALDIAANKFLEEENMETDLKTEVVHAFKWIHECCRAYVSERESKFAFPIRLSPPAFIELILSFKNLLRKKQAWITARTSRFAGGIEKLELTSSFVNSMRKKLMEEDQPRLAETSRQTELLMVQIEEETIDVEWTKEKIASDQGLANRAAAMAQQMRDECTKELAEAVPAMESAIQALDTLVPEDIVFLRALKNPPIGIKMVLEAVAILLEFPPDRRNDGTGYPSNDYWAAALRMLNSSEVKLLEALKVYDKDHINPASIRLVRDCYLRFEDFDPLALRTTSIACESLAKWVKALDIYDRVINVIKPKKKKLIESEKELAALLDRVYNKRNELQAITDRLQGLSDNFASISKEKKDLEADMVLSQQKVDRAVTLLDGLEVEKERWRKVIVTLRASGETLIGDSILAAAFVVYSSGMSQTHRNECLSRWQEFLATKKYIKFSKPFNVVQVATTPLEIQSWILAGLPSDGFNMENAMILSNSKRYCLIIDPMRIGNDFIKKLNQGKGLMMLVEEDELEEGVMVQIKKNITRGKPVLLEDINLEKLQNPFVQQVLIKDLVNSDGVAMMRIGNEEVEYNDNFDFFMSCNEYIECPRQIYSRICFINWNDAHYDTNERRQNIEEAIQYKEKAKKEKQLIELENLLLESLSSSEVDALEDENAIRLLMNYKNLASEVGSGKNSTDSSSP